jgi:hypothetical protein
MSLRGVTVEEHAELPDGREALVQIGVPDDPYVQRNDLDTVALELVVAGEVVATLNTVLEPEQQSEARRLAREVAAGLEAGQIEPTAAAVEPFADRLR